MHWAACGAGGGGVAFWRSERLPGGAGGSAEREAWACACSRVAGLWGYRRGRVREAEGCAACWMNV